MHNFFKEIAKPVINHENLFPEFIWSKSTSEKPEQREKSVQSEN